MQVNTTYLSCFDIYLRQIQWVLLSKTDILGGKGYRKEIQL